MKKQLGCNHAAVFTTLDVHKPVESAVSDLREGKELFQMMNFTTKVEATGRKKAKDVANGEQEAVFVAVADADGDGIL